MAFETTRKLPTQEHFYIVEIDLPIITGLCEITEGVEGYGTPLSCPIQDGTSATEMKTYRFCTDNAPLMDISPVYRCLSGINEQATELQNGKGLAIRGRATVSFQDFTGDPNTERAAGEAAKNNGTFFGKFGSRNIFENREVRIIKYRKSPNLNLSTDGQTSYYVARELKTNGKGTWALSCADELSKVEYDQAQAPKEQNSRLRQAINSTTKDIPVDDVTDWNQLSTPYVVRIGEEFMTVTSVSNNQTATAELRVENRGTAIGAPDWSQTITQTINADHDAGDDVFICLAYDDENIADVLSAVLQSAGIDPVYIPINDWYAEIAEWHPNNLLTSIFYEPEDADIVVGRILEAYLLNLWFDPIARELKLKAISSWVEASSTVNEGKEIDYESLSLTADESIRYSRAFVKYNKPFLANPDEDVQFKKASIAIRPELETVAYYGTRPKTKRFDNSILLDKDAADLLVSRYVDRFGITPVKYAWTTQERNLNFNVGDVVNINALDVQGFDGLPSSNTRAQIIKIQPVNAQFGREYKVNALTYQPASGDGAVYTINSSTELNLFVLAGAPPSTVNLTFIFDGGDFTSSTVDRPAVKAGGFASGSKIIIILRNGADWQSKGGDGDGEPATATAKNGGTCYDAQGVDTDIYLSGTDSEGGTANGFLRSPGGGGGHGPVNMGGQVTFGGSGGAGNQAGLAGVGIVSGNTGTETGTGGTAVDPSAGVGGDWGQAGGNGGGSNGGLAGKGLVKGGAVVTLFGDTALNFINGGGDAPD